MESKKYILFSLLLPCLVVASDGNDTDEFGSLDVNKPSAITEGSAQNHEIVEIITTEEVALDEHKPFAIVGSDAQDHEIIEPLPTGEIVEADAVTEDESLQIKDLPGDIQGEVKQALQNVGVSIAAATALLNNSFGRIALMGFLGYKSLKNFKRAFTQKIDRNVHISKGISYLIAAGMLSQDGYTWLLNR